MKFKRFSNGGLALVGFTSMAAHSGCASLRQMPEKDALEACLNSTQTEVADCTVRERTEFQMNRGRIEESIMLRRGFREFM
jgi:hypothetical protein